MARWLGALVAAAVLVALGAFFWWTGNRSTIAPEPVAQAPAPARSPPSVELTPPPAAAQAPAPAPASPPVAQTAPPAPAPVLQTSPLTSAPAPVAQTPAPADATAGEAVDADPLANAKATTELASLKSGFGAKDLIAALNDAVVNFASESAVVPTTMADFLKRAADDMKQLPPGHVLEIAGYTDSSGDPAANITLSQKRAEAVRDALIQAGASPDMLVAKGYGSADPIASNDMPEGRLRNRRIEYRIIKTP